MAEDTNGTTEVEYPVGLTARGRAVLAGRNALAVDGDDTLSDEPSPVSAEQTAADEDESGGAATDPGPAAPRETAVAVVAEDRETRSDEEA